MGVPWCRHDHAGVATPPLLDLRAASARRLAGCARHAGQHLAMEIRHALQHARLTVRHASDRARHGSPACHGARRPGAAARPGTSRRAVILNAGGSSGDPPKVWRPQIGGSWSWVRFSGPGSGGGWRVPPGFGVNAGRRPPGGLGLDAGEDERQLGGRKRVGHAAAPAGHRRWCGAARVRRRSGSACPARSGAGRGCTLDPGGHRGAGLGLGGEVLESAQPELHGGVPGLDHRVVQCRPGPTHRLADAHRSQAARTSPAVYSLPRCAADPADRVLPP